MKTKEEILSELSGYDISELIERQSKPLIQPFDCFLAMDECWNEIKVFIIIP